MATPAQQLASRANGALSHGPSSVEGKAISSRNSLKLGITAESMILPGEDPALLEQLTAEYYDEFHPVGPVETALLHDAIRAQWMRNRYYRIETAVLNMRAAAHPDPQHALAAAFEQDATSGNTLQRLFRRRQAADRDWRSALQLLEQLQNHRGRAQDQDQDQEESLDRKTAPAPAEAPTPEPKRAAQEPARVRLACLPVRAPQPEFPAGAPTKANLAILLMNRRSAF